MKKTVQIAGAAKTWFALAVLEGRGFNYVQDEEGNTLEYPTLKEAEIERAKQDTPESIVILMETRAVIAGRDPLPLPELKPPSFEKEAHSQFTLEFWRISHYASYDLAKHYKAVYGPGDTFDSWSSYKDAISSLRNAVKCMDADGHKDLMVRININGTVYGDFALEEL